MPRKPTKSTKKSVKKNECSKKCSETVRKRGCATKDFSKVKTYNVLKKANPLLRTDWGGSKQPLEVIKKKLAERGCNISSDKTLQAIKEICEEQVAGCRKRVSRRINEAINRCIELDI